MPVTIRVEEVGTAGVKERFLEVGGAMRSALRKELLAIGKDVQSIAQGRAPMLTGKLRQSIKARLQETDESLKVTVKPGKFYGQILESGVVRYGGRLNARPTSNRLGARQALRRVGQWRIAPRPFMRPARREVEPTARQRLEAAAEAVIRAGG